MLVQIAPIARKVSAQKLDGVISRSLECLKCTDCGQKPPECELQTADCFIFAFAGGHAYPVAHLVPPPSWHSHPNLLHPSLACRISAESRALEAPNFGLARAEQYGLV